MIELFEPNRWFADNLDMSTSVFPGITATEGQWYARTTVHEQRISLGRYDDELTAAEAVNRFWRHAIKVEKARRAKEQQAQDTECV